MSEKIEYLECECNTPTHMIRLIRDDDYNEKYIGFYLVHYKTFWGRLKACFVYLFFSGELDFDYYYLRNEDKEKFISYSFYYLILVIRSPY